MNLLLIADTKSIWAKEFIDKVLLPIGASVSLQADPDADGRFDNYYRENGVRMVGQYQLSPLIMKVPKIRVLHRVWRKRAALKPYKGKFDAVIILYVTPFAVKCAKIISDEKTKIYAMFIGSDILRIESKDIKRLCKLMKDLTLSVVCESCQTAKAFHEKIGENISVVANTIYLGNTVIPHVDEKIKSGRSKCKQEFNIPENRISVCVGYNASPAQQHLKVVEQLKKLTEEIKSKIYIIIPAAYGGTKEYISEINSVLQASEIEYGILTEFLNEEEAAALRAATDVFINAQTTDAIAASVMEAYYAGACLISAKWLKYQEFSNWNLEYTTFKSFDELNEALVKCLDAGLDHCNRNRMEIFKKISWNTCKDRWSDMLNKGETKND